MSRPAAGARRRLRRRVRPLGWPAPVAGSLIALGAWEVVAHSSGSGWVQALGAVVAGFLAVGMVAPVVPAHRARVACLAVTADAAVGEPVEVVLETNGPLRLRPRAPAGAESTARGPSSGRRPVTVVLRPARRGVVGELVLEVASSAPFGLLWWGREVVVPLPRALHVAPRLGAEGPVDSGRSGPSPEGAARTAAGWGDQRGVRPYVSGDSRRAVHWPATAHVGSLMVRETERVVTEPVVVEVVLPEDPVAAESACEQARGTGTAWLGRGRTVLLVTDEEDGRVAAPVRDHVELGRRLARAVTRARPDRETAGAGEP